MFKSSFQTLCTVCIWDLQYFQSFRNCSLFCTIWLIRNFYSGHEQRVNYGKHSWNDHYQRCAHCAYEIYSICKVFEIALCFAQFGLFEISTPVMSNMLTMANIVGMIITNVAHTVHMRFTVFAKFSKWLFVLHIFPFTKFLLRRCATC